MSITTWVIILCTTALIVYDVYAVVQWGNEATISVDVYQSAKANPIIAFAAGILCGHLFWGQLCK